MASWGASSDVYPLDAAHCAASEGRGGKEVRRIFAGIAIFFLFGGLRDTVKKQDQRLAPLGAGRLFPRWSEQLLDLLFRVLQRPFQLVSGALQSVPDGFDTFTADSGDLDRGVTDPVEREIARRGEA